jgi:DNA-binding LacI/PurR family transcriptional regulator
MSARPRVTLRDIANRLGVSHSTVSMALKNHPEISAARQAEVREMAREMGYRPDPVLSSLIAYRHGKRPVGIRSSIAWLNHWKNPRELRTMGEYEAYWQGAAQAAERFGYRLDEFIWSSQHPAGHYERILLTRGMRGILIPPHPSQPDWGEFHWEHFAVVRFGLSVRNPDVHTVTADQMRETILAMTRIWQKGYRRIGFVIPTDFDSHLGGNYSGGYYAALDILGIPNRLPPLKTLSAVARDEFAAAAREFKDWYRRHRPDAILTTTAKTLEMIRKCGLRVPRDVALASTSVADIPNLAGINQNSTEIGRVAVDTLVALLNGNDLGKPATTRRILVDGFWQDGASLPPAPAPQTKKRTARSRK